MEGRSLGNGVNAEWLGTDLKSWAQSKTVDQLAAESEIEPYLLNSIDLYLLVCDKILERDGDRSAKPSSAQKPYSPIP